MLVTGCFSSELLFNVFGIYCKTEEWWGLPAWTSQLKFIFFFNSFEYAKMGICNGEVLLKLCRWVPLHGWRNMVWCIAGRISSEQVGTLPRALLCLKES